MRLGFRLTLDGMVRALRLRAHAAADRMDPDETRRPRKPGADLSKAQRRPRRREGDHDASRA